MLQDTYEVACDIVHRPARLDVIGMGGGTKTAKVWHNEVIIILGRSCGMCYSGEKTWREGIGSGGVRVTYLELFDLFRPSTPKTRPTMCHDYRRFSFWIELNVI